MINNNAVCKLLGIKYPIIQGGMAWVSDANLAAAVSNAGGLGTIAAGNAPPNAIAAEIKKTRALTNRPFALNIMLLSPYAKEIAQLAVDEAVPVVITGAGALGGFVEKFKEKGIKYLPVVPSVAIAKHMAKCGADAVIAEGMEAGGHIGKITTMCLVPQVADAVNIPVVAAGGIADYRGMAAAFMLGASAVQIGTRFVVAKECTVHQNYKNKILKAKDIDTEVTGTMTGDPVRALKNKQSAQFIKIEKEELAKEQPDISRLQALGAGGLRKAAVEGDIEYGSLMAGQIAGMISKEQTCKEIIEEIYSQFTALILKSKD